MGLRRMRNERLKDTLPKSAHVTICEAIATAAARLFEKGVENARLDAEVLLCSVLGRDRAWLVAHYPDSLDDGSRLTYEKAIERRTRREPLQYITGEQEFWGLPFIVSPDVLIPRPETELVVEESLRKVSGKTAPVIVDLCTGSGCIVVSLAHELPQARFYATDRSERALTVAQENALLNGVAGRICFLEGDLFGPLAEQDLGGRIDLVTANPPYVRDSECAALQPEVRDFEPKMALFSGPKGTEIAERITRDAPSYLRRGGSLVMEMGIGQAAVLRKILAENGNYSETEVLRDLAGIDRVIVATRK